MPNHSPEITDDLLTAACNKACEDIAVLEQRIRSAIGTARVLVCFSAVAVGVAGHLFDIKNLPLAVLLMTLTAAVSLGGATYSAMPYAEFKLGKSFDGDGRGLSPSAQALVRVVSDPRSELERLASEKRKMQEKLDTKCFFTGSSLVLFALATVNFFLAI